MGLILVVPQGAASTNASSLPKRVASAHSRPELHSWTWPTLFHKPGQSLEANLPRKLLLLPRDVLPDGIREPRSPAEHTGKVEKVRVFRYFISKLG